MFLPCSLFGAVFDCITLELPLNVTAAVLDTNRAPPLDCNDRQKETREKLERNLKEEAKNS